MFKLTVIPAACAALACACAASSVAAQTIDEDTSVVDATAVLPVATVVTTPRTLAVAAPTAAEKYARSYQTWMTQVNVPYANQLGSGNGSGVVVGVVDSGVQVDHPMLKGRIVASYNAYNGGTDVTDQMGHGTHVSGIIAGSLTSAPFQGVAPGAKIAMAKVFTTGSSDAATIGRGIDWVVNVQRAPILSLSLGSATVALQTNIQNAVAKGTLITAALGNDGKTNAASWPAEFAKAAWANGQIIAVGAVDANNKRASFSNYDPTLANWTIYAPGVNVASSYSVPTMKNAYVYMSGTSMATPVVAGEAALIKSNWNFLTAQQIAQIIFQSATHLCSDAVTAAVCAARSAPDAVYGWGLANVGAALQPIGALNIPTSKGATVAYATTLLGSSKSGIASGLTGISTIAVDNFNRGFNVNLSASSAATVGLSTVASGSTATTAGGLKFAAEYAYLPSAQDALGLGADSHETTLGKASMSFQSKQGKSFALGMGGSEANYFGLESTGLAPLNLTSNGSRFNAPFFGLAENANHMGYGVQLSDAHMVRWGLISQASAVGTSVSADAAAVTPKTIGVAELQSRFSDVTAVTTLGLMQESGSVLGFAGQGAAAIDSNASTTFVSLALSKPITNHLSFSAMGSLGTTAGFSNGAAASLIDGMTASTSMAWSVGLSRKELFYSGDSLGLTLAMPLRTMSGAVNVTTAVAQDSNTGELLYATQSVGLAPSGTEHDIELSYARPLGRGSSLSAMAQARFQPNHDAYANTQYGLGVRYSKAF